MLQPAGQPAGGVSIGTTGAGDADFAAGEVPFRDSSAQRTTYFYEYAEISSANGVCCYVIVDIQF